MIVINSLNDQFWDKLMISIGASLKNITKSSIILSDQKTETYSIKKPK